MQALRLQISTTMIRRIAIFSSTIVVTACSSVEMIDGVASLPLSESCNVRIFQTRSQAEKIGDIEEVCIVNGTSSGSFSHTVQTAISKHKSKVCRCGTDMAYIESRRESGLDVATVTLIGFRITKPAK